MPRPIRRTLTFLLLQFPQPVRVLECVFRDVLGAGGRSDGGNDAVEACVEGLGDAPARGESDWSLIIGFWWNGLLGGSGHNVRESSYARAKRVQGEHSYRGHGRWLVAEASSPRKGSYISFTRTGGAPLGSAAMMRVVMNRPRVGKDAETCADFYPTLASVGEVTCLST